MKKNIVSIILTSLCFLLQSTLFSQFQLGGIVPNLMVVILATSGFLLGNRHGMWIGFAFGIITDILFGQGQIIGLYGILYMFVGYINGVLGNNLFPHDIKLPLFMIVLSDFAYSNVCFILFFVLRGKFNYFFFFKDVIMPELIYTTVFACIIFPMVQSLFKRIDNYDAKHSGESYIAEE